jgi:hypothetical protein
MATQAIDQQKMEQFVHKVLGDTSALTTVVLGALGDKLGLFSTCVSTSVRTLSSRKKGFPSVRAIRN